MTTREGNVMVIVVGGVISQILNKSDPEQPPTVANDEMIAEFLTLQTSKGSNVILFHERSLRGESVRIKFEKLGEDITIEQRDSAQVNPKIWADLVKLIKKNYRDYEGFVVMHGLDTLAYTASAVSFMIRNQNFPIVFTGSQRPLNNTRSDAPQNIYVSIAMAAAASLNLKIVPEVTIFLHDTLFRGNRASMSSATSYRSFNSLNYPPLAGVGEHIDVNEELVFRSESQAVSFSENIDAKVEIIDVFPGMSASVIESLLIEDADLFYIERLREEAIRQAIDTGGPDPTQKEVSVLNALENGIVKSDRVVRLAGVLPVDQQSEAQVIIKQLENRISSRGKVKGVILRTYGMGTAPTAPDVLKALKKIVDRQIIVMNVTQAHSSGVTFNADPVTLRLFEQGVISGLDMTAESAFAKMVVVLSDPRNTNKGNDFCEDLLQDNLAGEQSHKVINFHFNQGFISDSSPISEGDYYAKLVPRVASKEFELKPIDLARITNIQVRVLGLKKIETKGGKIFNIRIMKFDEDVPVPRFDSKDTKDFIVDDQIRWENIAGNTINISFDITDKKRQLFGKNSALYVVVDQKIAWTRISFVVYC